MKPLFTDSEYQSAKTTDLLKCECYICNSVFTKTKGSIKRVFDKQRGFTGKYCSKACLKIDKSQKKNLLCGHCNIPIIRQPNQVKQKIFLFSLLQCKIF